MKFVVSEKNTPNGTLLVVTDQDIIDNRYEQGKLQLDLKNKFYAGDEKEQEYVLKRIEHAYIIHLTGIYIVALALKHNLISPHKIITIKGIPHAEAIIERVTGSKLTD
jgi:hypothetical protein